MIKLQVDQLFDLAFDIGEIEHHPQLIEVAGEADIQSPALTKKPSGCMQIGEVDDSQTFDKQRTQGFFLLFRRERTLD